MSDPSTSYITVSGCRVRLRRSGEGAPLVVLHGASGAMWLPFMDKLMRRFEVIAPEHPGYTDPASIKRVRNVKVAGKTQSIEELIASGVVIVGSPETVREKLAEYQDLAGFNASLTKTQFGRLPNEMARAK